MTKERIIVGIDPDTDKSGIGHVSMLQGGVSGSRPSVEVGLCSLPFPQVIDYLTDMADNARRTGNVGIEVYVEAGWMERVSNYHAARGRRATRIAKNVGSNHQTGKHIIEMLEHHGIPVRPVHPLRKCWKGKDRKITHAELDRLVVGLPRARTNQEERDALLLAWVHAGLPIRM